tara:strand:- start:27993 stop:29606 length:1614 start_codon:yes stop_codon:yes gene_type:complete
MNNNENISMTAQDMNKVQNVKKTKSLSRTAASVGSMTFISRIFGFIRDMICAHVFGASPAYDAFLVAFKIPNFLRRLFAEGAFSQAFIPILSDYRMNKDKNATQILIDNTCGILALVLAIITVLGIIFAPYIARIYAPGFDADGERYDLVVYMLRITLPYIFLISLTAFISSVLNTYDRFVIPAITPVLLNISLIIGALFFTDYVSQGVIALAWAVTIGGVLQLIFQLPFIARIRHFPKFSLTGDLPGVKLILSKMAPALFGVSVAQISLLFDTVFASFLPKGSVTWLYYSDRLMQFPLGIFGVALATVVLPHLSRAYAKDDLTKFSFSVDWALRVVFLIATPAALGLFLLSEPLLISLFNYGKFTQFDVIQAGASLKAYSLGLLAFIFIKILASAFYAQKNTKTPVKIAAVSMVSNIILSLILMQFLQHVGLALAVSISSVLNAFLLMLYLYKQQVFKFQSGWVDFLLKMLFANLIVFLAAAYLSPSIAVWFEMKVMMRILSLFSLIIFYGVSYFIVLHLIGFKVKRFLLVEHENY